MSHVPNWVNHGKNLSNVNATIPYTELWNVAHIGALVNQYLQRISSKKYPGIFIEESLGNFLVKNSKKTEAEASMTLWFTINAIVICL